MFIARLNNIIHFIEKETLETSVLYTPVKKIVPTIFPKIMKDNLYSFLWSIWVLILNLLVMNVRIAFDRQNVRSSLGG